jgi:hypothetical protein
VQHRRTSPQCEGRMVLVQATEGTMRDTVHRPATESGFVEDGS